MGVTYVTWAFTTKDHLETFKRCILQMSLIIINNNSNNNNIYLKSGIQICSIDYKTIL